MIKDTCTEKYGFTYTIIPIEAIYDVSPEIVDLKTPSQEELKTLEEEKKQDYENHTALPDNFEEVKDKVLDYPDLEKKRAQFDKLIQTLPIESCFREDLIFYMKRILISEFCLKYNFKKALFGTNSHKVATQLLA